MTLHRLHLLSALSGLLLLLGTGTAAAQTSVRCESTDGQYKACSANTSGGVTLARQLSSQGCWQNDTWGYDRNRIWVNRGCRAEFRIGSNQSSNSGSNDGAKIAGALVLGVIAAAAIANHNDRNDNRYDNNYNNNYNNSYNNGSGYNNGYYGNNGRARELTCESKNGRYTRCGSVNRRSQVEIRRQLSSAACTYGRSWGVDGNQLWVDDGCRAVFVTY